MPTITEVRLFARGKHFFGGFFFFFPLSPVVVTSENVPKRSPVARIFRRWKITFRSSETEETEFSPNRAAGFNVSYTARYRENTINYR